MHVCSSCQNKTTKHYYAALVLHTWFSRTKKLFASHQGKHRSVLQKISEMVGHGHLCLGHIPMLSIVKQS